MPPSLMLLVFSGVNSTFAFSFSGACRVLAQNETAYLGVSNSSKSFSSSENNRYVGSLDGGDSVPTISDAESDT